jgi:hypothetical protein
MIDALSTFFLTFSIAMGLVLAVFLGFILIGIANKLMAYLESPVVQPDPRDFNLSFLAEKEEEGDGSRPYQDETEEL